MLVNVLVNVKVSTKIGFQLGFGLNRINLRCSNVPSETVQRPSVYQVFVLSEKQLRIMGDPRIEF